MNKKIILATLTIGILSFAQAQQPAATNTGSPQTTKNKPSPEMMATRHSKHLTKILTLTAAQQQQVYQACLTRFSNIQQIRDKYQANPDKKAMHAEIKPVREQFVQTMNGILTPEQKTQWEQYRTEQKQKHMQRKGGSNSSPANGNGAPQKLNSDDDGIDN